MTDRLRPFFSFYGGKYRAAKLYPPPGNRVVIEPFAGAAGYSTYWSVEKAVLYDADPIIAGVWDYLIRATASDVLGLPDLPVGAKVSDLKVCQEARWLIGFWCNPAASAPRQTLSKWARAALRDNGCQLVWCSRVRDRLAAQVGRIRRWTIVNASYAECPNSLGLWFVDPPYESAGKHYRVHDVDYAALAAFCRSRFGPTVVCENAGAEWLPFEHLAHIKAGGGSKGGHSLSHEVVWYNSAARGLL